MRPGDSGTGAAVTAIEVYADIGCPFTHIGLREVLRWRDRVGRDDVALRVRAWPLELVNGAPLDPATTEAHIEDLRSQVAPGLFALFDPDHFPRTTLPALALAAAAYRRDDGTGEAVSLALRDSLFEQGRDISRPEVLAEVATAFGLGATGPEDEEAVLAEWHEGESRGVEGSPHFFCGDVDAFCPSLDISTGRTGDVHVRRDTEALDRFLARCFET